MAHIGAKKEFSASGGLTVLQKSSTQSMATYKKNNIDAFLSICGFICLECFFACQ